jgi:predicted adenine nucleotide alpha hydrolase (AANH) superfamily ATPase
LIEDPYEQKNLHCEYSQKTEELNQLIKDLEVNLIKGPYSSINSGFKVLIGKENTKKRLRALGYIQ